MSAPIKYYNRYTGGLETESVYGESWLRWAYENPLGRLSLPLLCARPWFSRWYGKRMSHPSSTAKIADFIRDYSVDTAEFIEPEGGFRSFNDFFMRRLKPEARPIDSDPASVVFPADGRHLGFANAAEVEGVFIKGQHWDIDLLVGDPELANRFRKGVLILSRLCPVDYHHFHFAAAGCPGPAHAIAGALYSVSPIALRRNLAYMWRNYREVTVVENPEIGVFLQIEIGATNVGTILQNYQPDKDIAKGDHKGCFSFGGSSVITLFPEGSVALSPDLLDFSHKNTEVYAKMGDKMGMIQ
jgi:phosphatidylserine decarboxylase